ncbi:MAG: EF-Tu/IF-2/RF-3 family GTPase [Nitrospirales bacterium]|nr:EF-Tu/IF-2/RF-3 family GTPase [Nitrospirales bacterium]
MFTIGGRGTVVTGRVERGQVKVGDEIEIVGLKADADDRGDGGGNVPQVLDEGRPGITLERCCGARRKVGGDGVGQA